MEPGASHGSAGTTSPAQGLAPGEAVGGGVLEPTPVDRKLGA